MVRDSAADKARVRRSVRLARAARGEALRHESDRQLAGVLAGLLSGLPTGPLSGPGATGGPRPVVGAYVSLPGEPSTHSLRRAAAAHGCEVLLPWLRPDLDLDWVRDDPEDAHVTSTREEALRPPGPLLGTADVLRCRLLLVPAIAVDTIGNRLGQGGGSYDRVLRRVRAAGPSGPLVLAVVHPEELLDAALTPLPHEPHDMAVDGVLTTSGVRLLSAVRSSGPAQ